MGPAWLRTSLAACLLALAAAAAADEAALSLHSSSQGGQGNASGLALRSGGANSAVALTLCECEKALGSPDGLSCEREGWFISSFEREGSWLAGGGLVPLSRAVCCRPCLPGELPPDPSGAVAPGDKPVALVSLGCHVSTAREARALLCEEEGGGFVTGWERAVRVSAAVDAYYPIGAVQCCTPSLLLASGVAWELERCECEWSGDINCGGSGSGKLLYGFENWRMTSGGDYVPIAPARCCKACLADGPAPVDSCAALGYCNGHGVCSLGVCQCQRGYGGADCSLRPGDDDGLPQWAVSLIVLGSCAAFSMLMAATGRFVRAYQMRRSAVPSDGDDALREPLLGLLADDDDGSAGSEDTASECGPSECGASAAGEPRGEGGEAGAAAAGMDTEPAGVAVPGTAAERARVHGDETGELPAESFVFSDSGVPLETRRFPRPAEVAPDQAARPSALELPSTTRAWIAAQAARFGRLAAEANAAAEPAERAERHLEIEAAGSGSESAGSGGLQRRRARTRRRRRRQAAAEPEPVAAAGAELALESEAEPDVEQGSGAPRPVKQRPAARPAGADSAGGQGEGGQHAATGSAGPSDERLAVEAGSEEEGELEQRGDPRSTASSSGSEAEGVARAAPKQGSADSAGAGADVAKAGQAGHGAGGANALTHVECTVCMSHPVQVVIIPCGHACLCRRCSRRLSRCPICRKEVLRRQKLYMGG